MLYLQCYSHTINLIQFDNIFSPLLLVHCVNFILLEVLGDLLDLDQVSLPCCSVQLWQVLLLGDHIPMHTHKVIRYHRGYGVEVGNGVCRSDTDIV